jgi:hypothetical protein
MTQDDPREQQALEAQDRIAAMSDKEVKAAYEATSGAPGDPWADFLAQAMQERGIDL